MDKVNINLAKILRPKYSKKWVALDQNQTKIVAQGKTVNEVLKTLRKVRISNPVLTYVVDDYRSLVSVV